MPLTNALAITGGDVQFIGCSSISAAVPADVSNLTFVHNFGYSFSISLGTSRRISNALPSPILHVGRKLLEAKEGSNFSP